MPDTQDTSPPDDPESRATRGVPAVVPSRALAVRQTCVVHRWDTSTRRCVRCGARVYVEVMIS